MLEVQALNGWWPWCMMNTIWEMLYARQLWFDDISFAPITSFDVITHGKIIDTRRLFNESGHNEFELIHAPIGQ